jgi:hypothetical protein
VPMDLTSGLSGTARTDYTQAVPLARWVQTLASSAFSGTIGLISVTESGRSAPY